MVLRIRHGKKWERPLSLIAAFFICGLFLLGCDSSSSDKTAVVSDTEAPTKPANLTGQAVSATQINLSWEASTDNIKVAYYEIYRDNTPLANTKGTSHKDTGLTENKSYVYEVRAYDAAGNKSAFSDAVPVTASIDGGGGDGDGDGGGGGVIEAVNVFLDEILDGLGVGKNYQWFHGSTSPDRTKILVTTNKAAEPQKGMTDTMVAMLLDAKELEKGKAVLLHSAEIAGGSGTMNFRSSWTPDGSKIALAGGDRFFVLKADTLEVLNNPEGDNTIGGHNHDALTTSDGKYALLTVREGSGANMDGSIQLYDMVGGAPVGAPVKVCSLCHAPGSALANNGALTHCGLDGELSESGGKYSGTVYIAGHGGHFAKVALNIDPAAANPVSIVGSPGKLEISTVKFAEGDSQYKLHDARLDGNTLYWSTYNTDANGQAHYGKINVDGSGKVDIAVDVDPRATIPGGVIGKAPIYCASGQTDDYHMPMTMTNEAYITVIPKSTLTASTPEPTPIVKAAKDVFLDKFLDDEAVGKNYTNFHGSSNPDRTELLVTTNLTADGAATPTMLAMILDAAKLEEGKVVVKRSAQIAGGAGTANFRSSWTPDGSKIALAAGNRFFLLKADDLSVLNDPQGEDIRGTINGHNHDALTTMDGKYAILTLRSRDGAGTVLDGMVQLYNLQAGQYGLVGDPVSVCSQCHTPGSAMVVKDGNAAGSLTLCGLDGVVTAEAGSTGPTGKYLGTIYVAGHGGHFSKVSLEINPAAAADKVITVKGFPGKVEVAGADKKLANGTSTHKLHDVRFDGSILYWSTFAKDADGKVHYGKMENDVKTADIAYGVNERAGAGASIYCASGQTDRVFMPMTMTNEAYITVIPKLGIK